MVSRRDFLAALCASTAGLAGCSGVFGEGSPPSTPDAPEAEPPSPTPPSDDTPSAGTDEPGSPTPEGAGTPTPDPLAERFDTIYDVVEEGVDDTGSTVVDDAVQDLAGDDTLLRFPPGTYKVERLTFDSVSNLGLVGPEATIEPTFQGRSIFLQFRHASDILFDGFTVDNTAEYTAAWCDVRCVGGENVVRDYTVEGFVDVVNRTNGFTIMVEGGDTSLTVENADLGQGAINGAATYVFPRREFENPDHEAGTITFRDCVMKGWGKEGLYASAHEGPLNVIGGEYANNAIAQVRVGAGNAPERTVVRGVTVVVDNVPSYMPERNRILRGIWLKEGDRALVEDCDITLAGLGPEATPGAIYVNDQFGRATIRNCSITTEGVSRPAILVQRPVDEYNPGWMPSLDNLPPEWDVTVEDVSIDGRSANTEAIRVGGRDNCTFRNVTVEKEGQASDGIYLRSAQNCVVEDSSFTTARFPVLVEFDRPDDCVLSLTEAELSGTDLDQMGSVLSERERPEYCLDGDTAAGRDTDENELALTRTTAADGGSGSQSDSDADAYQLHGRWVPTE